MSSVSEVHQTASVTPHLAASWCLLTQKVVHVVCHHTSFLPFPLCSLLFPVWHCPLSLSVLLCCSSFHLSLRSFISSSSSSFSSPPSTPLICLRSIFNIPLFSIAVASCLAVTSQVLLTDSSPSLLALLLCLLATRPSALLAPGCPAGKLFSELSLFFSAMLTCALTAPQELLGFHVTAHLDRVY